MMFNHKTVLGLVAAATLAPRSAFGAHITINSAVTAHELVNALIGDGVAVKNARLTGASGTAATFIDRRNETIFGFSAGIILSTGDVETLQGPNNKGDKGASDGVAGDADLDTEFFAATSTKLLTPLLEFEFKCDDPLGFSFEYVFGSEEYNEFVDTAFKDVFAFFLNNATLHFSPMKIQYPSTLSTAAEALVINS
jgi:hypothetical protein